jgi:RNA recognition motif-containing protein
VIEVSIRRDRNGLPSIGFVTMKREQDARAAIEKLNGASLDGRALNVALAHRQ